MFDEFIQSFYQEPGLWSICLRLACAMLVGLIIGTEREYTNRPAGMRTHVLVALGACVASITGVMLNINYSADPGRLAAQVVTGVGFLGAGTILREGFHVKGLTTAASVWTVACLGISAGYGYYAIALAGTLFAFVTLTILEFLQDRLPGRSADESGYELYTCDISAGIAALHDTLQAQRGDIHSMKVRGTEDGHCISFRAAFHGLHAKKRSQKFFAALAAQEAVRALHRLDKTFTEV